MPLPDRGEAGLQLREQLLLVVAVAAPALRHVGDVGGGLLRGGHQLVEGNQRRVVGRLRRLHRGRVGLDPHHRLLELLGVAEELQGVVVRLRHLLPVHPGDHRHRLGDVGLRHLERLAELLVELHREVAGHLDVLLLVLPHRHRVGLVEEDVGRHQYRVGEEAVRGGDPLRHLVLVAVRLLQHPHRADHREEPRQLVYLRHRALAEEDRFLRVQPAGQEGEGHLPDALAERRRVVDRGQRVVVGHEIDRLRGLGLPGHRPLDHAEIIAEMERPRGLDSRKNAHRESMPKGEPACPAFLAPCPSPGGTATCR